MRVAAGWVKPILVVFRRSLFSGKVAGVIVIHWLPNVWIELIGCRGRLLLHRHTSGLSFAELRKGRRDNLGCVATDSLCSKVEQATERCPGTAGGSVGDSHATEPIDCFLCVRQDILGLGWHVFRPKGEFEKYDGGGAFEMVDDHPP